MSTGGQPRNLMWKFPTIALRISSKASVDPVGSDIGEETRVAPHRPGASKRELQPPMETSAEAMDAVPGPVSPTRPDGPDSNGASRIGVDTDRNHFLYTQVGGYIRHVPGSGLFGDCICPLVPFHQDLVSAHRPDQWTGWQAWLRELLLSRAEKDLSQLHLAPRPRPRRSTRRAPARKKRSRSPAWEESETENDTYDEVILDEESDGDFCVESSGDDSGIQTSDAATLKVLESYAELSPLKSPKEMSPRKKLRVPPITSPKKNLPKLNLIRDISDSESSNSDLEMVGPLIVTTEPKVKEGNTTQNLKNPSPLVAAIYKEKLEMEKRLLKKHWEDSDCEESLLKPVLRSSMRDALPPAAVHLPVSPVPRGRAISASCPPFTGTCAVRPAFPT